MDEATSKATLPSYVHKRNDIPLCMFPGVSSNTSSFEAQSHRKLTLPGSRLKGAWTDTPEHFDVQECNGILHCHSVWWLHLGGVLHHVPAGRWEATFLLRYEHSTPCKSIYWCLYVNDDNGEEQQQQHPRPHGHIYDPTASDGSNVLVGNTNNRRKPVPAIHVKTGRHGVGSFESVRRNEWTRYSMGTITTTAQRSNVQLLIRGMEGTRALSNVSFGGLELQAVCVDWRREALLLRMLRRRSGGETPTITTMTSHDASNESKKNSIDATAMDWENVLPKEIVVRVAQFLITPLPQETLLLHNYSSS